MVGQMALDKSIEHNCVVLPFFDNAINNNSSSPEDCMAAAQAFLKAKLVVRGSQKITELIMQYSETLEIIGLIAMPLKSSQKLPRK